MTTRPPAAWYADPAGSGGLRYWDGAAWTDHVTSPPTAASGPYAVPSYPATIAPPAASGGRRLWPIFAVIAVLFVTAVIAGIVLMAPRVMRAGGHVTDVAAQSTARATIEAAQRVYAFEGSYVGATPQRLADTDGGVTFTNGVSTDFQTASIFGDAEQFVVAVRSLSGRCYVARVGAEVGGPVTTGRLPEGGLCGAAFVLHADLVPEEF